MFVQSSAILVIASAGLAHAAVTANQVLDYDFGTGAHASYRNVATALGETSRNTGTSGGTLFLSNAYNNPWRTTDWVSIGKGGHITLQLEKFALPQADAPEINVLVFQQLTASGQPWYARQAKVSVSANGTDWVSLGASPISFNTPATGYVFPGGIPKAGGSYGGISPANLSQYQESDYGLPMPGAIAFGAGAYDSLAAAYGNSGGGNWLDISGTGLSRVGYVRFDVATDAPAASGLFALDAVYVNNAAVGATVPEPATASLLLGIAALGLKRRRRH